MSYLPTHLSRFHNPTRNNTPAAVALIAPAPQLFETLMPLPEIRTRQRLPSPLSEEILPDEVISELEADPNGRDPHIRTHPRLPIRGFRRVQVDLDDPESPSLFPLDSTSFSFASTTPRRGSEPPVIASGSTVRCIAINYDLF